MQDAKQGVSKTTRWIIRKSKTREGRVYYFNTETGEALWHLSDAEIENAKKATQSLDNQSEEMLQKCPEPKDPPLDNKSRQYIYNKKVINNRFTSDSFPLTTLVPPQCNYVVPPCNSGTQIGLNITSQNCNEVWSVPPTHHIIIAPADSPVVTQSQVPGTMHYNDREHQLSVQNTVSHTRCFENNSTNDDNSTSVSPKYFNRRRRFTPRNNFGDVKFQKQFYNKEVQDLRNVLCKKRRQRQYIDANRDISANTNDSQNTSSSFEENEPEPCTTFENHIQQSKEEAYLSEAESTWIDENVKVQVQSNLDITCLRNLAAADADPDRWYIAVDRTILLYHPKFLKMMLNSDVDCFLLVPREELNALREMVESAELAAVNPRLSDRARRALDFVQEQFDSDGAMQGEELETNSTSSHILNCCLNVAEQKYHVILLCNDNELLAQRESVNFTMCNINELKAFLTKSKEHDPKIAPEIPMEITISNDFTEDTGKIKTFESISVRTEEPHKQDHSKTPESNTDVETTVNSLPSTRVTIKTGVQTDSEDTVKIKTFESISVRTEESHKQEHSKTPEGNTDVVKTTVNSLPATRLTIETGVQTDIVTPKAEVKRREIRLRRNYPNQASNSNDRNTTVNQFRWRTKRNVSQATNDSSYQTNSETINKSTSISDIDSGQHASQVSVESGKQNNICNNENMEGSDASNNSLVQRTVPGETCKKDSRTIEETSTSGVISNTTASNHDAESVTNEISHQFKTSFDCNTDEQEDRIKNNYMFHITSQTVEEHLRMRSDEWISRFVQIMEEVLSQVLQQKKSTHFHLTPPPWDLQEALQCILRSSNYYGDVKDAAKKLSNTLLRISDKTGKIKMDLKPTDFMEMYSYGVYLVDALQGIELDFEDLKTASGSLVKLLKDINEPQNTDLDNSMNMDNTVNNIEKAPYNLRSRKSTPVKQKEPPAVVRILDTKDNFLTNLDLQRKVSEDRTESTQERGGTTQEFHLGTPPDLNMESNRSNFDNGGCLEDRLVDKEPTEVSNTETKFIRRINKSPEHEDQVLQREPLDLDKLDYSANYDDNYHMEDDYYNEELAVNQSERYIAERYPALSPDIDSNTDIDIIKGLLNKVKVFCENTNKQLCEVNQSLGRRKAIHDEALKVYNLIENIVHVFNSVVHREADQPLNRIQARLETAGIDLNNTMFIPFRETITKLLAQASILLEALVIIMSATKT